MNEFATLEDIENLWRNMSENEKERAKPLLAVVSDSLRGEADKVGKDLDKMIEEKPYLKNVAMSVTVDIVARTLMTSTNSEPMTQMSQSALGYSTSGTFLVPGGGIFIKKTELSRLGIRRQRCGVIELYGDDERDNSNTSG
ncbi:phage Gp19/Gp15/Gp42 family protein [Dorea acetigenes]|uniref:Phage Gp19/Gp15/Gp42 family protein n=1 Tax=Dorea acetigenes TaxID=2981787 RepID=A0ABT2RIU5_9FIRM|nr:phage Gp19/Gp15/Gp42 family protein [Dorea acetigenes]MCU6685329.1 phage Gp19/Gp15/Gp42 family protein [Dorea acetigenes]SCI43939.1 Phage protein Gp19/Gp15/Gp42 [uncultured Clostridium sp.]